MITSQVPVSQWHDVIADPTLGDAILDRIIHNAHRIELKGDSLRRQAGEKKKTVSTSRTIAPPAHRPLPRASLRRSWGHSAQRTGPAHGPPGRSPNQPANLDEETISSPDAIVSRVRLRT